ncbi:DUF2065 domain-containing protein [Parasedimentitalea psychrophila]|uniref:DUF2065 domain-containing protein n=1 Tax=Parasedimentitalea psychrophila TaxID=2997337 RepID=A0A9Y2KXB0_9RHOB|nr:DUF2065 domain-containing protein [Parasedimentitalea psychrophila]WIY23562.1 DUF2065 domain-containing protein [Parasedimentitalea psychrophila]
MAMIFLALGLVFIVEGLAYVLAPSLVERLLQMMRQLGLNERRQIGAMAMGLGLVLLWIAHLLGA